MTSPANLHQHLLSNKLLVGGKVSSTASHSAPGKAKAYVLPCQRSHHSFWLSVSNVAAQHRCLMQVQTQGESRSLADSSTSVTTPHPSDLLIIGPGVLGAYLGKLWAAEHPDVTVTGQTNSSTNHHRLQQLGIVPRLKQEADERTFPNVVFCAPPSGCEDYEAEVKGALQLWDGSGSFVFTSSAGLFDVEDGSQCNEDSPVHALGESERFDRLLRAEKLVLDANGCVIRLAGLYHANRGAHTFFLRLGKVERWPGYIVNLLHYEDAALLCLAALKHENSSGPFRRRTFVGTDGSPITFQEMIDATLASGCFEGSVKLTGEEGRNKGKLLSNKATREALGWTPRYPSFESFMARGAQDFYRGSPLF